MKTYPFIVFTFVITTLLFWSCKEEVPEPYNPYDYIVYPIVNPPSDNSNPNSLSRTHQEVFEPKCNVLGCHDGSFEPDFRTPQSTYSTLVYHSINKNNLAEEFEYRVIPYDKANSVLWERITNCCFVNDNDRMPQDNIGISMPQESIDKIGDWILAGAPDLFGNVAQEPDALPNILYFGVYDIDYDTGYSNNRIDDKWYNPFIIPQNTDLNFVFTIEDDKTPNLELLHNTLSISTDINDFSNAQEFVATCLDSEEYDYPFLINLNSSLFNSNQQYFMRYATKDAADAPLSEYPENDVESYYKSIWSFIVE